MNFEQWHLHQYLGQDLTGSQRQYRLWIPGEQVITHHLQLPAAARRKWSETVPWLLEDQLIDAPEDLQFSMGRADAGNRVAVLSVPRTQMDQWLALCESGPGRVVAMLPDYLALPWEAGGLSLLIEGERWIVRCGPAEGYAGDADFVAALLARQLQERPDASVSYVGPEPRLPDICKGRSRHLANSLDWSFCDYPRELNLLRGDYRPAPGWKGLQSWWPSLAAASLCLLLALGNLMADFYQLKSEIPQLQSELSATYRSLFGGNLPSANVRSEAQKEIVFRENQYLASAALPLSIMVQLDSVLSTCNDCQIKSVSGDSGKVELRMTADATLEGRFRNMRDVSVSLSRNAEGELLISATLAGVSNG